MKAFNAVARNIFLALSLLSTSAQAGGLVAPFSMDSTETLPRGIRNVTIASFTTDVSDAKNGWSNDVAVGGPFNKSVTWGDLINAQKAGYEKNSLQGYVQSKGYSMGDIVGNAYGVVDIRVTGTIPVIAYGVTDNLTLAVVVPILYSNLNVSTGWAANQNFNMAIAQFSADGKSGRILQNQQQLMNVVATDVASKGYSPLQNETRTDLGDVTIAAKYRAVKLDNYSLAIVPKVVLPTGVTADVNKLIDVAPGAGAWDIGIAAIQSYQFDGQFSVVQSVGFTKQIPFYRAKRIPFDPTMTSSPDVDQSTRVELGDIYSGQIGPKYKITPLFTLGGALAYQYKSADVYSGAQFDSTHYDWMSINTEQVMFSGQLGLNFSTISLYKAKSFPVPLEVTVSYANVFSGRNVNTTEMYSAAMSLFF